MKRVDIVPTRQNITVEFTPEEQDVFFAILRKVRGAGRGRAISDQFLQLLADAGCSVDDNNHRRVKGDLMLEY